MEHQIGVEQENYHATGTYQSIVGRAANETEKGRKATESHRVYQTENINHQYHFFPSLRHTSCI